MPRFTQVVLQPESLQLAGGPAGPRAAQHLRACAAQTKALLQRGYLVPVLARHAVPGSAAGAPLALFSQSGGPEPLAAARNARVGRLLDVGVLPDGSLAQFLEITHPAAVRAVTSGRVHFTSPELRARFVEAGGRESGPLIAHVALTTVPRCERQTPLVPCDSRGAAWRRLLTFGATRMTLDPLAASPNLERSAAPPEPTPAAGGSTGDPEREPLPGSGGENPAEEWLPPQPETDTLAPAAPAADDLVSPRCRQLAARIRGSGRLPRGIRERLAGAVEAIQFSSDRASEPSLTVLETLELLEEALPPQLALAAERLATSGHPRGEAFFTGAARDLPPHEAARIAAAQLAATGFARPASAGA